MEQVIKSLDEILEALNLAKEFLKEQQIEIALLKLRVSNLEHHTKTYFYMKNGGQG